MDFVWEWVLVPFVRRKKCVPSDVLRPVPCTMWPSLLASLVFPLWPMVESSLLDTLPRPCVLARDVS